MPPDDASHPRATTEAQLHACTIGELRPYAEKVIVVDYDPSWPALFEREAERVRSILGARVLELEHAGSTSVPGLPAKPIIDMLLVVADAADETAYAPALEAAGYILRIREPDWFEHRLFRGPDTRINMHVFSQGCSEVERMLAFRDWLRANPGDRQLYATKKQELAQRDWKYVQHYADAKTSVITEILARAGWDNAD